MYVNQVQQLQFLKSKHWLTAFLSLWALSHGCLRGTSSQAVGLHTSPGPPVSPTVAVHAQACPSGTAEQVNLHHVHHINLFRSASRKGRRLHAVIWLSCLAAALHGVQTLLLVVRLSCSCSIRGGNTNKSLDAGNIKCLKLQAKSSTEIQFLLVMGQQEAESLYPQQT